jgi:hypothetical protein
MTRGDRGKATMSPALRLPTAFKSGVATATVLGAVLTLGAHSATAQQRQYESLATSPTFENRPTEESSKLLMDELLFQRASQTYLWALPLINTMGMKVGSENAFGAGYNVLPIWKKRLSAKTLVTTPNSDVIYAMSYLDLGKDGPLVFEAPPGLQGILLDFWQRPIEGPVIRGHNYMGDVGFFGPDQGKGGKFLLLPPGYQGEAPEGYFPYRSKTNNVFVFLRGFYQDAKNLGPAVATLEKTRIYPLGKEAAAKAMIFPDASGVATNMLPRKDASAFDQLKQLVDSETRDLGDPDWMGMLAALGIEKGVPFTPDAKRRKLLDAAAGTAYQISRTLGTAKEINGVDYRVFPDRQWINPMASGNPFDMAWHRTTTGNLALDARANFFTNYYSWSPGMVSQVPGKGANYMVANFDAAGKPLSGTNSYKISLPPKIPAANFWSVTLYDAEHSSGLDNGQPFPSLGSRDNPRVNADGSIDLYFGAKPPAGKEGNWLATVPGRGFFAIIRLYSPTEGAFDGSWKPSDFEETSSASGGRALQ